MGFTTILENENGEVGIEIYTGNPPDNYEMEIFPSMDALVDRFDRDRFKAEQLLTNTKSSVILSNPFLSTIMMNLNLCLLYTSPSPRDRQKSRMPSSA